MHFLYIILIALANNLDNISVRIAYSVRGIRIPSLINLWISCITFCIATFAAWAGGGISSLFNSRVTSVISMLLLTGIGIFIIKEQILDKEKIKKLGKKAASKGILGILGSPELADKDNSKEIDFKEATLLGIALSLDNIGGGFSAGMMGFNMFFMGLLSALVSFMALWAGNLVSEFLSRFGLTKKAAIISGIVLIAIGLRQFLM